MEVSKFNEKLNKLDGKIYTMEEVVCPIDGIYEGELIHDNVNLKTLNVYTGSKLTGDKINTYTTSTPSLTPWKNVIKIFSKITPLYISYETIGDTVEAEDINKLQNSVVNTQENLNKEIDRAITRENNIEKNLNAEIERAKLSEKNINDNLNSEITRAKNKENELLKAIENEMKRASDTESKINNDLNTEINRAENAESMENTRAINRENVIENNLNTEVKRATDSENSITKNLEAETNRSKKKEEELKSSINEANKNLNDEITRSKASEQDLLDGLNSEINRAKISEKTLTDNINTTNNNLNSEITRSNNAESTINNNLSAYKNTNNAEIQKLKEKDEDLQSKKADKAYVDTELNKRYLKEQVFTKDEVLGKMQGVIGSAPEALDTLVEIAKALNNDPNFANTIINELSKKVDKVVGKSLSTEDYTTSDKNKLAKVENEANKYIHPANHSADMIVENSNKRFTNDAEKEKWNTVGNKIDTNGGNITGVLKILGAAESKCFITRGIQGSDGNGELGELYLNYNTNNPVYVNGTNKVYHQGNKPSKSDVGLGNVDNTSDLNKPISTATQNALNGKANSSHTHNKANITDMPTKLSQFTNDKGFITSKDVDTSQNHVHNNKSILDKITQALIDNWNNKANTSSVPTRLGQLENDKKYVTQIELGNAGYGDMLKTMYDKNNNGKVDAAELADEVAWSGITGKPSTFAPSSHTHTKVQITDFPTSLPANGGNATTATKLQTARTINGVSFDGSYNITITANPNSHTHTISSVTGLQSTLDRKVNKGTVTWNDLKGV